MAYDQFMTANMAPPPIDADTLWRLACRYVERYATSKAKLKRYLEGKIRARGWLDDNPEIAIADTCAKLEALGAINEPLLAQSVARSAQSKGFGRRRVAEKLGQRGLSLAQAGKAADADPLAQAILFARRKRLGPFGAPMVDPKALQRALAAMARAGHAPGIALKVLRADLADLEAD
jgi:regulatory protein